MFVLFSHLVLYIRYKGANFANNFIKNIFCKFFLSFLIIPFVKGKLSVFDNPFIKCGAEKKCCKAIPSCSKVITAYKRIRHNLTAMHVLYFLIAIFIFNVAFQQTA